MAARSHAPARSVLLLQPRNGALDLLPHMAMKRKFHLAPRTLERGSFLQVR